MNQLVVATGESKGILAKADAATMLVNTEQSATVDAGFSHMRYALY